MTLEQDLISIGKAAREAAKTLAYATAERKHAALVSAAHALRQRRVDLLAANAQDIVFAEQKNLTPAMIDRLRLDDARIEAMARGLEDVAALPDPVGQVIAEWDRPTGLHIQRVRTPLGVVGVIYESRPNVTADAGALCLKSGNAAILRGGSDSYETSGVILEAMQDGLRDAALPIAAIQRVPTQDRAAVGAMLKGLEGAIDVIVPRGGRSLVERVQNEARVPVFAHLEGICHIYIDKSADLNKAIEIVVNAKMRRTGICGAAECVLFDAQRPELIAPVVQTLIEAECEVRGCETVQTVDSRVTPATEQDYGKEFLDAVIAAKVVPNIDEAIEFIQLHHSQHTDAIITEDEHAAQTFFQKLDSAILMWNTSTQFADGGEFGMGAEIGIATGKMHARGPVGAEQLTSFKYLVSGNGAIRA